MASNSQWIAPTPAVAVGEMREMNQVSVRPSTACKVLLRTNGQASVRNAAKSTLRRPAQSTREAGRVALVMSE